MSSHKKVILKTLKELDTIWHPDSKLVFKSKDDKKVIGRYENNEFIEFDDEALELCKVWKFKYDEPTQEKISTKDQESSDEDNNSTLPPDESVEIVNEVKSNIVSNLSSACDDAIQSFSQTFSRMFSELSEHNKKLEEKLTLKNNELEKLMLDYTVLNKKFLAIKDLFS
jgi:hypothetical protein